MKKTLSIVIKRSKIEKEIIIEVKMHVLKQIIYFCWATLTETSKPFQQPEIKQESYSTS